MSDNAEHLEEDHNGQHKDDSDNNASGTHVFSCIFCATGLHDQCRGEERYKSGLIICECERAGHPEGTTGF